MQNTSYTIQKFSEKFQKITTINQAIDLSKEQKFNLEIDLTHRTPSVLVWDPSKDSLRGDYRLLVYPVISIDGKKFSPKTAVPIMVPEKIGDFEKVFLEALKVALDSLKQVWN